MARRSGLVQLLVQNQREAEKRRAAQLREQKTLQDQAEKARKNYERAQAADQKEQAKLYAESRQISSRACIAPRPPRIDSW